MMLCLTISGCNILQEGADGAAKKPVGCAKGELTKILYIGNSYSSFKNIPELLYNLSCDNGKNTEMTSFTVPGNKFSDHLNDNKLNEILKSNSWDIIILQGHHQVASMKEEDLRLDVLPSVKELKSRIIESSPKSRVIFLQNWGLLRGDRANCHSHTLVCTYEGHTQALLEGNTLFADETNSEVVKIGNIWLKIYLDNTKPFFSSELWHDDGSHPSSIGSYVVAAGLYAKIFSLTTSGGAMPPEEMSLENFNYINRFVDDFYTD